MYTKAARERKPDQSLSSQYSNSQKKSSVSKSEGKKPKVRATEFSQIIALLLNDPDSVTRDEFMFFQSKLGYSQTVRLMSEGRKRKQMEKQGKKVEQKRSPLALMNNDNKVVNKDTKKSQEEKTSPTEVKSAVSEKTTKPKEDKKQETTDSHYVNTTKDNIKEKSPTEKPHTEKSPQVKQTTQQQTQESVKQQKAATKSLAQSQNAKEVKAATPKTQENTQIKHNVQTKAATPEKKQPAPSFGKEIASIASATAAAGQKAKKTPVVKIKAGDPGSLLSQLENVPPTQALNAYSQVTALSGEALKGQTQKTQKTVPQIKAPTGITAISKNKKAKKTPKTFNHAVPTSFKAEKTGKAQDGAKDLNININSEAEPDEILAQAKHQTANTPVMEFTGEADPSQMEGYNAEMSQNVQTAKQQELGQIHNDFGENSIFPDADNTILKANKALKGTTAKAYKAPKALEIPVEMEAQLNKTLGPKMKTKLTEQKEKYQTGREKFDSDVKAARAESDSRITAMKTETSKKQQAEQKGAQAEVERQRKQWRQEIDGAVADYDKQAEAETKNKTKEISKIKEDKNKEIKEKMAKAESDANQECKTAKKKAEDKKKENEKEKEKEDKPWYAKAIDWVKDKAQKFIEGLKQALNFIFDALRKAVKFIFDLAKKAINGLIELGRRMVVGLIRGLGTFLKGLVKIVFSKFPGISNKICGFIDKTVDKAVNIVNTLADTLKKGVNSVLDFLSGTLDKLLGFVQSAYNGILTFTGMLISGQFAEIMEGIKALGEAAKASLPHIEGKVWEQLIGVDLTQPLEEQAAEGGQPQGQTTEKLTENDIVIEQVEKGEITPELLEDINLKDGETKELNGSSNPHTTESIMEEFDTQKTQKTGNSFADGVKTRAQNAGKILDQIKQFVIKWLKDNWWKLLLGVLGALAGIVAAEIVTGGAITAALPAIINVITTAMNAAMVVSIIDTIAKAAGYIETYLTQGWARHIQPAAIALATALAMGLVELAMALGFKFAEKGIKAAKGGIKKGIKATAGGAKKLVTTAGKGIKSLLKSGAKLVSKTGSMIIENGKIIIKSLKNGFSKGAKKLKGLIDKILSKFRFRKFKIERKGLHIRIYGEVNPWVLLYDGTIEKIDRKNTHAGDIIEHEGKSGIVITRNTKPTAKVNDLNALSQGERKAIYENGLKNGGKVEIKGGGNINTGGLKNELNYTPTSGVKLKATPGKTTTILGTFNDDTGKILDELGNVKSMNFGPKDGGFNLLNTPDDIYQKLGANGFWEQCNKPWLDNAIARKDIIVLATEPTPAALYRANIITGKMELSGFGREYQYLLDHGYTFNSVLKQMIPK
ncbi:hypothetical protein [Ruminiclostridium papyrosolvens]|uniref:Uncharacterized protein n=1 Tax=Ruminiclostridium papyrosolvens C7 TaxID=1330534 RepID=U4R2W6_9FIRM|nr:hypothetical protein [Ruminiclostridium papyrosolvens]EPR12847.1 hypothetical protein L323_06955 [Ruminiclostridium papyrosolvens C7]